jgi:hypothetical protein
MKIELSEEEIKLMNEAMFYFTNDFRSFVLVSAQKSYKMRDGSTPTTEDRKRATDKLNRVEALFSRSIQWVKKEDGE